MNHYNLDSQEYARFGQVSVKPLGDTRKLVAKNTSISWSQIPHVTHHDEVSIDSIQDLVSNHEEITLLSIVVKAVCETLKEFPQLNASLSNQKDALMMKRFYNIGIAVDTEQGLLVLVVKGADRQTPDEISKSIAKLAKHARDQELSLTDSEGGTFTVTSLGIHGGTSFTPIIKFPEVAILGIFRVHKKVVAVGSDAVVKPVLALSLSYDVRAVDGLMGARFMRHLCGLLEYPNELFDLEIKQTP